MTGGPPPTGPLRVVTVGTGTCVPRADRGGPCTLLQVGEFSCVVDLGLGALHGLLRAGVAHRAVDAALFTHPHPDHVSEWVPFLFAANYDEVGRTRELQVVAHPDTLATLDAVVDGFGHWLRPQRYRLTARAQRSGQSLQLGPLRVAALATRHLGCSLAYRLQAGARAVVVSGDTGPCEELVGFAAGADLLLIEASCAPGGGGEVHLDVDQACEIGQRAGVGQVLLHHLYPAADAVAAEVVAQRPGRQRVTVARDGMEWLLR